MKRLSISRFAEWSVLAVFVFSVLWRGGKGLEATWLLALCAGLLTLVFATKRLFGLPLQNSQRKTDAPLILWGMVMLFTILTIISYAHSSVRNYGLDTVLRTVSLSLLFLWLTQKAADTQSTLLMRFRELMTLSATIAVCIGLAVYILQPVNRFVGTFFDFRFTTDYWPNAWGQFLLVAWPIMLLQAMQMKTAAKRNLVILCMGLVLGALMLSYSRGALLALCIQLGLLVLFFGYLIVSDVRYKRFLKSNRMVILGSIFAMVVISGALFLGTNTIRAQYHDVQSITEKITFTASEGTSSIDERSAFWHQAFNLSKEHPWLGYGPYSFRFVQPQVMDGVLATSDHAHNMILNTALDSGWPVAILLVLIIAYAVLSSSRRLLEKRREWSQERDLQAVLFIVAVLGVSAHNMIDYNLQFVGIALPFWMCLGYLVVPATTKSETNATSLMHWKMTRYFFEAQLILAIILLGVTLVEGIQLIRSSAGRHSEAAGNTDAALLWYYKAHGQWFSRDMHLSEAELYLQKDDMGEALQAANLYIRENSFDPRGWKEKGIVLLRTGDTADAALAFEEAYKRGKYTDLGLLGLLLQSARTPAAKTDMIARKMEFDTLFSLYANAIEHNTHFIALSRNVEELQSVSRQLSALFPTDEKRYKQIARSAAAHAQDERSRYTARTPGKLW